jgi:hypothetical protein
MRFRAILRSGTRKPRGDKPLCLANSREASGLKGKLRRYDTRQTLLHLTSLQ